MGVLTEKRILKLRDQYFPRRLRDNRITVPAYDREIATLNTLLTKLGVTPPSIGGTPVGTGPVILDAALCGRYGVTLDTTVRELKNHFPSIFVEEF